VAGEPNRMRELRTAYGWSTQELANRVGTTHATISRLESGKQQLTQEWILRFAQVFGVRAGDIIEVDDKISYALVIGTLHDPNNGSLFDRDEIYSIPVPGAVTRGGGWTHHGEIFNAFETESGWLITSSEARPVTALQHRKDGATFVVEMRAPGRGDVLSARRFFASDTGGPGLETGEGDPALRWLPVSDKRVLTVWRVLAEYRKV
jgi:transcriptional regulator with XRE-family HTH domain